MKEILKKNQAITLVSLVVTIIILIILAGVSINLILGKNGIITMAKQAKENIELAKIEEETALNELYMQIEAEGGTAGDISYDAIAKLVEFKREIASAISDMGVTTLEDADATTMANNIRSISGASSADKVSYDNTNSSLTSTNVQSAIDEINNSLTNVNHEIVLWSQDSASFSAQTITIDNLSTYKRIGVYWSPWSSNIPTMYDEFVVNDTTSYNMILQFYGENRHWRYLKINGNNIVFDEGMLNTGVNVNSAIPIKIVGIK